MSQQSLVPDTLHTFPDLLFRLQLTEGKLQGHINLTPQMQVKKARAQSARFHAPVFMHIHNLHIKTAGWKRRKLNNKLKYC